MFHLWPQGRIVRICVMALGALIAADLGYTGAYAAFATYSGDAAGAGAGRQLILGILYAVLALGILLTGLISAGPHQRAVQFFIEVQDEMTKVVLAQDERAVALDPGHRLGDRSDRRHRLPHRSRPVPRA